MPYSQTPVQQLIRVPQLPDSAEEATRPVALFPLSQTSVCERSPLSTSDPSSARTPSGYAVVGEVVRICSCPDRGGCLSGPTLKGAFRHGKAVALSESANGAPGSALC